MPTTPIQYYTTATFIANVQRLGAIPQSQATFQPSDILSMADREIQSNLLPMIMKTRESYYSYDYSFAITGTNPYAIPARAIAAKVQNLYVSNSATGFRFNMSLETENEVNDITQPFSGEPSFFFKGNYVWLSPPQPSNFDMLTMSIFIRPNQCVEISACAMVLSIAGNVVTVNAVPSTFSTSTPLDIINGNPHFDCYAIDQMPTAINGSANTITFSALPSQLQYGDWISLQHQTPVIQIPLDLYPILEQRVANSFLQSQGFSQALQAGKAALTEMADSSVLISPRSERNFKKIVPRSGIMRRSSWWP